MKKKYELSEAARVAQREYIRKWRQKRIESFSPDELERYKEKNREYHRRWRAAHKDSIREAKIKYWEKKAAEG